MDFGFWGVGAVVGGGGLVLAAEMAGAVGACYGEIVNCAAGGEVATGA